MPQRTQTSHATATDHLNDAERCLSQLIRLADPETEGPASLATRAALHSSLASAHHLSWTRTHQATFQTQMHAMNQLLEGLTLELVRLNDTLKAIHANTYGRPGS